MQTLSKSMENKDHEIFNLLSKAMESGVSVSCEHDDLLVNIPKDKQVDRELIQMLKKHKRDIIVFLNKEAKIAGDVNTKRKKIVPFDRSQVDHIPLSFAQERLWIIDQLSGTIPYHMPAVLRLRGKLDTSKMQKALRLIVERHEALRTVVKSKDEQVYQFIQGAEAWQMSFLEDPSLKETSHLQQHLHHSLNHPFDLSKDYMLRAELIQCEVEEHILVVVVHHISSDGWSLSLLVKELEAFYQAQLSPAEKPALSPLSIQYADYAVWQRQHVVENSFGEQLDWWVTQLEDVAPLQLPTDFPRPAMQSTSGKAINIELEADLSAQLNAFAQANGVSLFMIMLTIWKVLLYRYSGQEDICVGVPNANRNQVEVESLVGFFVNTLAFRSQIQGEESFLQLLKQIKTTALKAYDYQEVPFNRIVEKVEPKRDLSRSPLFQVMFAFQNTPDIPELKMGNLAIEALAFEQVGSQYDLSLTVTEFSEGMVLRMVYCDDLFVEKRIQRMVQHYINLVEQVLLQPTLPIGRLNFLAPEEQHFLIHDLNQNRKDYAEGTVMELLEQQVEKTPNKIAVYFEETTLTYAELNARSNQLAHYLRKEYQLTNADFVGVMLNRSVESVIAMIGVMKSGACYTPIDPDYPEDRIDYILKDAGIEVLVTQKNLAATQRLSKPTLLDLETLDLSDYAEGNPSIQNKPSDGSFVIYTSGSTGYPKGVIQTYRMMNNLIQWALHHSGITTGLKQLQYASFSFDASLNDVYFALSGGGSVYVVSDRIRMDYRLLREVIVAEKVEVLSFPFSALSIFFTQNELNDLEDHQIKYIISTAEQLYVSGPLAQFLEQNPTVELHNQYGPSETHVVTSHAMSVAEGTVVGRPAIGQPISNTTLYILDAYLNLAPMGARGEVYIGGSNLANGYLNLPAQTSERFIDHPFIKGEKLYKTGDLAYWQEDGTIVYLGRKDDQVKIRGYRIELGEIKSVAEAFESIQKCIVTVHEFGQQDQRLVAYLVVDDNFEQGELKQFLSRRLPAYMIPAHWMLIDEIPLTSNGKINIAALPNPEKGHLVTSEYQPAETPLEKLLLPMWQDLLGMEQIGVNDHFFELGGHSLLAVRLMMLIRKDLEIEISLSDIFTVPTIQSMALYLESCQKGLALPPLEVASRTERIPLSFSQERLWIIDKLHGTIQYHIPTVLKVKGSLDKAALRYAFAEVVSRHEILRTVFVEENGEATQKALAKDSWQFEETKADRFGSEEEWQSWLKQTLTSPFDLTQDYMIRAHLVEWTSEEHTLLFVIHHIASDGWSTAILVNELFTLYRGYVEQGHCVLDDLHFQYADYAAWQRKYLSGDLLAKKLNWWTDQLKDVAPLQLPTDFLRPAIQSTSGKVVHMGMEIVLVDQLKAFAQAQGVSLFMVMLTIWKILLQRYSGQNDIC
ncbi:MAG: amino acid adenylation domain-containing protein, partial [Bacteroidota bacterium]